MMERCVLFHSMSERETKREAEREHTRGTVLESGQYSDIFFNGIITQSVWPFAGSQRLHMFESLCFQNREYSIDTFMNGNKVQLHFSRPSDLPGCL